MYSVVELPESCQHGDVVPIWFSDAPLGMFEESRKVGGLTIDVSVPISQEVERIVMVLRRKLADARQPKAEAPLQLSLPAAAFQR